MALNEIAGRDKLAHLPAYIPNRHAQYLGKKASSSGAVKPPGAAEYLKYYTAEQLRMHFAHMALQSNSGSFIPKAALLAQLEAGDTTVNEKDTKGFDATLAEGNILTNVFNRLVRSCFYSLQKYFDGSLPEGEPGADVLAAANTLTDEYEMAMYRFEFSKVIDLMDVYLRDANKDWVAQTKAAEALDKEGGNSTDMRAQTLVDAFHAVRIAVTLLHPFAPEGTERIAEYLSVGDELWNWEHIRKPLRFFIGEGHEFKFLEPRVDFFFKHATQLG